MVDMKITPFQKHLNQWRDCKLCPLCETRKRIVLSRGKVPAEVLFVGEGPGESEDIIGCPFVGPAGQLLDQMINKVVGRLKLESPPSTAFTNLVACIPKNPKGTEKRKDNQPSAKEIKACMPRVDQMIELCKPKLKLIVCVGKLAQKQGENQKWEERTPNLISIIHPSAILQADVSVKQLWIQRAMIQLSDAYAEL